MIATVAAMFLTAAPMAGCGGGGDTKTVTVEKPTVETETPAPSTAEDHALADRFTLRLDDLPTGWTTSKGEESPKSTCTDFRQLIDSAKVKRESKDFKNSDDDSSAFSRALVFETAADARRHFHAINFDRLANCSADFAARQVKKSDTGDYSVGTIEAGEQSVPKVGDESRGLQAEVPLSSNDVDVSVYVDMALTLQGRAVSELLIQSQYSPFDSSLKARMMRTLAERMPSGSE
jgi:hypothetical protein